MSPRFAIAIMLAACSPDVVRAPSSNARPQPVAVEPTDAAAAPPPAIDHPTRRIAAGGHHACFVATTGRVQCWGGNGEGELGRGTTSWGEPQPAWVAGIDDATSVAAGAGSTCVVHRTGRVSCWGAIMAANTPRAVPDVTEAKNVAVHDEDACALLAHGDVVCWSTKAPAPRPQPGLAAVTAIRSGDKLTCALHEAGDVSCWGHGEGATPQKVPNLRDIVEIAVGSGLLARARDGAAYIVKTTKGAPPTTKRVPELDLGGEVVLQGSRPCQLDGAGQIGCKRMDGEMLGKSPRLPDAGLGPATQLAASQGFACALHADAVSCWGTNDHGEVGLGREIGVHARPIVVFANAKSVRATHSGVCALDGAGVVTCWGGGDAAKLRVEGAPKLERLLESSDFTGVCGQPKDGDEVCWRMHAPRTVTAVPGLRGVTDQARQPHERAEVAYAIVKGGLQAWRLGEARKVFVKTVPTAGLGPLVRVTAGWMGVCVLDKNGKAACAAPVDLFELDAKLVWQPVEAATKLREINLGAALCGLEESGAVSCHGKDKLPPSGPVRLVPQAAFSPATMIARGYNLCALGRDDVVRCATDLESHGSGQNDQIHARVDFGTWKDVAGLTVGSTLLCGWSKAGEVRCAGSNSDRQLGIEDAVYVQEPRRVALAP